MLKLARTASAALLCTFVVTLASAQAQDPVLDWNRTAAAATLAPSAALAPVQQTRVMAIIQVAVHDAVNSITGKSPCMERTALRLSVLRRRQPRSQRRTPRRSR